MSVKYTFLFMQSSSFSKTRHPNFEAQKSEFAIELCPICGYDQSRHLFSFSGGALRRCLRCEVVFYVPRPSEVELKELYNSSSYRDQYHDSIMHTREFAEHRYLQFRRALTRRWREPASLDNPTLLDVGCGPGGFLDVARREGKWQVSGTELSLSAASEANQLLGNCVSVGDLSTLKLQRENYAVITMYHLVEHLLFPVEHLIEAHRLLRNDGALFIETPNWGGLGARLTGSKWSLIIPPEHVNYFTPSSLRNMLRLAGFEWIQVWTVTPMTIASIAGWNPITRGLAGIVYRLSCLLRLGPTLQALALKRK